MRTIKEWQREAYALAKAKGWHSRQCAACEGFGDKYGRMLGGGPCAECCGTGQIPIDPHSPTRIASRLALIHCEISEAVECVARGRMGVYTQVSESRITESRYAQLRPEELTLENVRGLKLEGFPIELADVFLRLCDLAESTFGDSWTLNEFVKGCPFKPLTNAEEIAAALQGLHKLVANIGMDPYFGHIGVKTGCDAALYSLQQIALGTGVDLLAMTELKHAYNKTRPIRHGGKVL